MQRIYHAKHKTKDKPNTWHDFWQFYIKQYLIILHAPISAHPFSGIHRHMMHQVVHPAIHQQNRSRPKNQKEM